jgi:thioredoxin 1
MAITTPKDLEACLKGTDKAVVLFYASWCPFSQRFLPTYEKYAKEKGAIFVKAQIDDMEDICDVYDIEVYPTVLYFEKGKVSKRLDGVHGEGLNEKKLTDFIMVCKV